MLTRLKVSGFKNLVATDVRFGPFTCIAGPNAVGKSNLFDAIQFLSALASKPILEAATSVRNPEGRPSDIDSLFGRYGSITENQMSFAAEMIIPASGTDSYGQTAEASMTFLRYELDLTYQPPDSLYARGAIQIGREALNHIQIGDARRNLPFPHQKAWRESVVRGRRGSPYISTEGSDSDRKIRLHQDRPGEKVGGRAVRHRAALLPRTVLSGVNNAADGPTVTLVQQEMRGWQQFQLEPSIMRETSAFTAPTRLGVRGENLVSSLYHLATTHQSDATGRESPQALAEQVYAEVTNILLELIDDVRGIRIDRDEARQQFTLFIRDRYGAEMSGRMLSDGTLRFLALAIVQLQPDLPRLLCLEEPENGIHPKRVAAMLSLLKNIAADPTVPVGPDNPLRQVIVNTHSPAVVAEVEWEDLLMATSIEELGPATRRYVGFRPLPGSWRTKADPPAQSASSGELLSYFLPVRQIARSTTGSNRVIDRPEVQQLFLPGFESRVDDPVARHIAD